MNNEKKQIILSTLAEYPHLHFADLYEKTTPATGQTTQQLSSSLYGYIALDHVLQEHDTKAWRITDKGEAWLKAAIDKPNEAPVKEPKMVSVEEAFTEPKVEDTALTQDEKPNPVLKRLDPDPVDDSEPGPIDIEIDTMVALFKVMESRVQNGLNTRQVSRISDWFNGCYGSSEV